MQRTKIFTPCQIKFTKFFKKTRQFEEISKARFTNSAKLKYSESATNIDVDRNNHAKFIVVSSLRPLTHF